MHIQWKNGFTIVEILIVIAVIGILTSIAVLNVSSSNIVARDSEREQDAKAIARRMEELYDESVSGSETFASYPGIVNASSDASTFSGIPPSVLRAPGVSDSDPSSFVGATNAVQTTAGVLPQPSRTNDEYVYQPLKADGTLCQNTNADPALGCLKFNLFYYNEKTDTVKKITSKNQ